MYENQSKEPWCPADVFFLSDALKRGMKPEAVAGFLGKTESEVIAKAKALRHHRRAGPSRINLGGLLPILAHDLVHELNDATSQGGSWNAHERLSEP
jgi:hypothetical protein